ncbi:HupE/UreJ family protein [Amaricoccus sp.]|uniref:HupE/UreJ family protein n=1 Tax=Amaricoccus sp. TaxID=1872485 RepID=UPI001B428DCC|nr:HupE/UreJ family protein [Amaricoccus sp.]MBP7003563.1 HupE/UreJ family protein [Amaricoccus sp.]
MLRALLALLLAACLAACLAVGAEAHEVRPAYLQIDQTGPDRYAVIWRTPQLSGAPLPVVLALPDDVRTISGPGTQEMPGSTIERRIVEIPGGLAGRRIDFVGLQATITDVLARVTLDGVTATTMVRPSEPWLDVQAGQTTLEVAVTYLRDGVEHILFGFDHLLFVAALMLIVRDWRVLIKTITAFTVAHSITLALATFGLVALPPGPVETLIALSIVLVAVEAVRLRRGETSLATDWPWLVAFAFGLLHGFGFAGALAGIGLPRADIPLALLFFNLGVETGQLLFIAALLAAAAGLRRLVALPRQAPIAAAYAIGIVASFWCFERLGAMFS